MIWRFHNVFSFDIAPYLDSSTISRHTWVMSDTSSNPAHPDSSTIAWHAWVMPHTSLIESCTPLSPRLLHHTNESYHTHPPLNPVQLSCTGSSSTIVWHKCQMSHVHTSSIQSCIFRFLDYCATCMSHVTHPRFNPRYLYTFCRAHVYTRWEDTIKWVQYNPLHLECHFSILKSCIPRCILQGTRIHVKRGFN